MLNRRDFLKSTAVAGAGAALTSWPSLAATPSLLPSGAAPPALGLPHFASRMQAFAWRNWQLVPLERMATTVGAREADLRALGRALGLGKPPRISAEIQRRAFITIIRRNWHLLPYDQLLTLLGWSADQLAFTLREDDFLFVKLGSLKPRCAPLRWSAPTPDERARAAAIAAILRTEFGSAPLTGRDPLFSFVQRLSAPPAANAPATPPSNPAKDQPRFCHSYFALCGDALLDPSLDPYPDGYLARLADSGVSGVWLHGLLANLSPFPWDERLSAHYEPRREQLQRLIARAARHGMQVYLYLNEPRARPLAFFERHPGLKGLTEGDHATLCTSVPEVRDYLTRAVEGLCRAVPDLGGLFTITASENLTHCWSHHQGKSCPRCSQTGPAQVIADVLQAFLEGIRRADVSTRLIAWDWGWPDPWVADIIERLPNGISLLSVSEWDLPIERGGIKSNVGEYSLSAIGPGPRAQKHWAAARRRALPVLAKIQAAITWELASVPYIPAVAQAWQHGRNLRDEHVAGLMLGWTLGGHPSPNLLAAVAGLQGETLETVAVRLHGPHLAPAVAESWEAYSAAFREFPFHVGCAYHAPWHMGPANLLWPNPTGYASTMVGLPYDDVDRWRAIYPVETWCRQLEIVADGFDAGRARLAAAVGSNVPPLLAEELLLAEACALHWRSAATQARWTSLRHAAPPDPTRQKALLLAELALAKRLHALQSLDSRLGFEASNHYFYVPLDLVEKVLNCHWLLSHPRGGIIS